MLQLGDEKMAKSEGNIRGLGDVLDEVGRDTLLMYFVAGHYRQPIAYSRERLDAAAAAVERVREAGRRVTEGDSPEDLAPLRDAFFDALADDFNTARALASLFDWIREANRRDGPVGDAHLREMLAVLGLDNLLDAAEGPPPELVELAERRAQARAARDFAEADRLRDELRAAGWEVTATAPDGPELVPLATRAVIVYGVNPVREALRGPREVRRIWAARGDWSGAPVTHATPEEIAARCGSDAHQGVCAEVEDYRYADAAELLARPEPFLVALDEVTDPQNLGAVCRTAEVAGATGVILPERRSAEVTPAVCKASAGAVEHLAIARVRNLADFLAQAKAAECWCYGAAAGAKTPYRAPDYRGGVVLVLGAEGKGLRPRVRDACDDLVALPDARAHRLAQRQRCRGGPYVRDIAAAA